MTIFSLKCFRCSKTNCPKYLKCIYCHSLSCVDCINETNPNRLTYKIMKNDKNGIEQSIYCSKHCNKIGNICNDCGGYYSNLKKCHNCFILFCSDCQQRNMENIGEYMIPGDDEYNKELLKISSYYCSKSCFSSNYFASYEFQNVCLSCGEVFIDYHSHGDCEKCMNLAKVDCDVSANKKRISLQILISEKIESGEIEKELLIKELEEYMKMEIENNQFIKDNKITFDIWLNEKEGGSNNLMVLIDKFVLKILEKKKE